MHDHIHHFSNCFGGRNMSVDANIILPHRVKIRDVANATGILAGLPITRVNTAKNSFKRVEGVYFSGNAAVAPQCVSINLFGEMVDRSTWHSAVYSFEPEYEENSRGMLIGSTPFWLAIGHGLIQFFGGTLICNDSCEDPKTFHCPLPEASGDVFSLLPATKNDLERMASFAAYPDCQPEGHTDEGIAEIMKSLNIVKHPQSP